MLGEDWVILSQFLPLSDPRQGEPGQDLFRRIDAGTTSAGGRKEARMSERVLANLSDQRQAMCLECGAVRSAKAQYLGRGTRTLRCSPCDRATDHAAVNWDGTDPRELANRKRTQINAEVGRQHLALLQLLQTCSIPVLSGEADSTSPDGQPQGGLVDVVRRLEPEGYQIRLQADLSLDDRVYCLDWAWRSMRPVVAEWDRCLVEFDLDGRPFQRIYNNELERGVYKLS